MNEGDDVADRATRAIASVFRGPHEDFVRRRDALAKELRAAGERELATTVKQLRKPSRIAWALDQGALEEPDAVGPLAAAVAETLDAQSSGRDVRAAMASLRNAVRDFASRSAHAAERAGHRVEPGTLASAVLAVLGRPDSFAELRCGCLVDVPEGGGLDFLAGLPAPANSIQATSSQPATSAAAPASAEPAAATASDSTLSDTAAAARAAARNAAAERARVEAAARAAAQQAVQHAAQALASARSRAQAAQQTLLDAEAMLNHAVARMRQAEEDVQSARNRCDSARRDADAAAAQMQEAEAAAADAQRRLDRSAPS